MCICLRLVHSSKITGAVGILWMIMIEKYYDNDNENEDENDNQNKIMN